MAVWTALLGAVLLLARPWAVAIALAAMGQWLYCRWLRRWQVLR
ncbi:MAG: hypothetical protein ORN49_05175 [Rhodobacteraceae bacterium]|nr:hypothetical protein [Paracoccaceae bacterium]